jgi:hypothetical protein
MGCIRFSTLFGSMEVTWDLEREDSSNGALKDDYENGVYGGCTT